MTSRGKSRRPSQYRADLLRATKRSAQSTLPDDGLPEDRLNSAPAAFPKQADDVRVLWVLPYVSGPARRRPRTNKISGAAQRLLTLADKELKICQEDVSAAVRSDQYLKEWALPTGTTKSYRRIVKAQAKTLRKVNNVSRFSGELLHLAKRGSPKAGMASHRGATAHRHRGKKQAVSSAKRLLTRFGGKPPGKLRKTRGMNCPESCSASETPTCSRPCAVLTRLTTVVEYFELFRTVSDHSIFRRSPCVSSRRHHSTDLGSRADRTTESPPPNASSSRDELVFDAISSRKSLRAQTGGPESATRPRACLMSTFGA